MRSDIVKKGSTRTAHRTLFHAMGYSNEDLSKPLIGVVNAFNEIIPGHIHLREIAQAVKLGVLLPSHSQGPHHGGQRRPQGPGQSGGGAAAGRGRIGTQQVRKPPHRQFTTAIKSYRLCSWLPAA